MAFLLELNEKAEVRELLALVEEYAEAKFGDEWWLGRADAWIDGDKAARLLELLRKYK